MDKKTAPQPEYPITCDNCGKHGHCTYWVATRAYICADGACELDRDDPDHPDYYTSTERWGFVV